MNLRSVFIAGAVGACLAVSASQPVQAVETTVEKKVVTVTGDIVRLEPSQHVIVLRDANRKEITYTLGPSLTLPSGLDVGRRVTLYTEPGEDGATMVTRVTTLSTTPEGNVKKTVEETRTAPSGETSRTTTTTVTGTVGAFEAGKSVTLKRADGTEVTYTLEPTSEVPADLAIGRTVVIHPASVAGGTPVARTITYTTVKSKHGRTVTRTKTITHQ
jgi:hypothetical protein